MPSKRRLPDGWVQDILLVCAILTPVVLTLEFIYGFVRAMLHP